MSNELVVSVPEAPPTVHLVARNPQEMAAAQCDLLKFLQHKVIDAKNELSDVKHAHAVAVQNKWSASVLKRQTERAGDRLTFYEKVLSAVEAGYTIVPNFPVDVFAIRVASQKPREIVRELRDTSSWSDPAQNIPEAKPEALPVGDGRYESPSQLVKRTTFKEKEGDKEILVKQAWPFAFGDIVFPIVAARPEVMTASVEAMGLKVFDALGICPQAVRRGDPLIIGRITQKKRGGWQEPKSVSFLIAWHLDLRTL